MDAMVEIEGSRPFALSDEHRAVAEMAREFADDAIAPHALEWDETRHFPLEVMREAAKLGMGAITVLEAQGGAGLDRLAQAVIFEQLATGCPTVSAFLSIHNMVTAVIAREGTEAQHDEWLPRLTTMEAVAAYCLTEPGSGSDAAALKTRAVRDGDDYVLDGAKQFISGGGEADLYLVMCRTDEHRTRGITAVLVPGDAPGLSFGRNERKMGWNAQPTRQVILESCRVPAANVLAGEGQGFRIAMQGLDGGRINIAACSLGGAQAAFERARDYTNERQVFGKPVSAHQAPAFQLADMATEIEACRLMLYAAAARMDERAPDAGVWSAMAKRLVTDRCHAVADQALQLHGGYGYLHEYGIEKIVRDLRVHRILEGTNDIMRLVIARHVTGGGR